jgi:hypothetical protein
MLQDYSFSRCSRRCLVGNRTLEPGEAFYSVVIADGENLSRADIAANNWQGPPPHTIGWWRSQMPATGSRKLRPAPDTVLLETLSQLVERPECEPLAYMLALLLVRRRVLTEDEAYAAQVTDEPATVWHLQYPVDGRQWSIPMALPTAEAVEGIQQELTRLLFTEE